MLFEPQKQANPGELCERSRLRHARSQSERSSLLRTACSSPLRTALSWVAPGLLCIVLGCSSSPLEGSSGVADGASPESSGEGGAAAASTEAGVAGAAPSEAGEAGQAGQAGASSVSIVNVFERIPQFGVYADSDPSYTPPSGVLMWSHGTVFVSKLSKLQQSELGFDLAIRVTYFAECDPYDRLGAVFLLLEPKEQEPQPTDARIELVRFITPFSDYQRAALAKHVYPDADVAAYAQALADPSRDVWLGIAGGSNVYAGDACTDDTGQLRAGVNADFASIGFEYSVDFVSTRPLERGPNLTLSAAGGSLETSLPIEGTFANEGAALSGHVTVIVSGHGSGAGGDEYEYTQDSLSLNGHELGSFSTQMDCAPYAKFSPDGNQAIFRGNSLLGNPRNWCPGALVPSHSFAAKLTRGSNTVRLQVTPDSLPADSYYSTSLTFSSP